MSHLTCERHNRRVFVDNKIIYHRSFDMPVRCTSESGKLSRKVRSGGNILDAQTDFGGEK